MSEPPKEARPTPLGIYDRPGSSGLSSIEIIAVILSAIWLLGAALFFLLTPGAEMPGDALRFLMIMLAIFMPVAMIWVAATAAKSSRVMREESARLQTAIDAIRQAYITQAQGGQISGEPSVARKLDEIAAAARKTETTLATFTSSRHAKPAPRTAAAPAAAPADDQPALELGTPAEEIAPPLEIADFIRALNFPETAEDEVGFAALRRAMRDRPTAQLVQASQDVLTLLSQDGIYMDDLRPEMARPETWRQFAEGRRGRTISSLGGVRDRAALALTAGRMREDPIFRDAAHHFLRLYDRTFAAFAEMASDEEIIEFSDTRTARAFMLLGRVAGTFD